MITGIQLKNFKCFKEETYIPFGNFNLLTGINAKGKSSTLQPLLLFRQSIESNSLTNHLYLNGDCVELGTFNDIRNNQTSPDEAIEIEFRFSKQDELDSFGICYYFDEFFEDDMLAVTDKFRLFTITSNEEEGSKNEEVGLYEWNGEYYACDSNEDYLVRFENLLPSSIEKEKIDEALFYPLPVNQYFRNIHYLSADRLGPQEFYLKSTLSSFPNVGVKGERVANILLKKKDYLVNGNLYIAERENSAKKNISKDLLTQTAEWLNQIFDGGNIKIEETQSRISNILFNSTGKAQDKHNKPSNVGFGFSYALPIIVSGLIAKKGEILIVENPEAHLHPKAQSRITKFLAKVSQSGVQVFIETHSDHVLNAARIAVLDEILTPDNLNVLFFRDEEGDRVVKIPVEENGGIKDWPNGFFDQTDKDYERLFGI